MLHSNVLTGRRRTPRSPAPSASRFCVSLIVIASVTILAATCAAADATTRLNEGGRWSGFVLGLALAILVAVMARTRAKSAEAELVRLRELANHCECERNLAQQELVKRLEDERELAKEKMQFESQLTDYETYVSCTTRAGRGT
jgi:heme A synthase